MNKILIALVLTVVMSGNAYANFITDYFKSEREMCLQAVEKGKLIGSTIAYRKYVYKSKIYYYFQDDTCSKTLSTERYLYTPLSQEEEEALEKRLYGK
tara:strand:+ start:36 stop:329 length:294 start_codon:yes stop_codon:yes gene_type:complete